MCAIDIFLSNPLTILIGCGPMTYRFIWESGKMDGSKWTDLNYIIDQGFVSGTAPSYEQDAALNKIASADHVHNIVFDTVLNVGIIGALLYLLLISGFIKNAIAKFKIGDKKAFNLTVIAITAIFISGLADVTIMWHQTATLFALMCAASFVPTNE
jgi:O-antigen ligase